MRPCRNTSLIAVSLRAARPLPGGETAAICSRTTVVVTGRVVLRLVTVSAPGKGSAARDFTAISEVSFLGDPED